MRKLKQAGGFSRNLQMKRIKWGRDAQKRLDNGGFLVEERVWLESLVESGKATEEICRKDGDEGTIAQAIS